MPTNKKTSPKVASAGISSGVVVVVVAMLMAITPEMLDFAGQWTPVIYAAVPALAAVLGAYIKHDPDRDYPDPIVGGPETADQLRARLHELAASEADDTPVGDDYDPRH